MSLWLLLATVAVCFGMFAWLHVTRCRQEQAVLAQLRMAEDGRSYNVSCFNPFKGDETLTNEELFTGGPVWLTRFLGVDPFKVTGGIQSVAPGNRFSYSSTEDGQLLIESEFRCGVDDGDARLINQLRDLRFLSLEANPIGDAGIERLSALTELKDLNLANTQITDRALEFIATLQHLKTLNISHTHVSDDGIQQLIDMPNLESLDVSMTRVTPEGVRELKKRLPSCKIVE
ncbi:MAG: hypothetical protein R3C02_04840 [Planctomycetaceae bacterium]